MKGGIRVKRYLFGNGGNSGCGCDGNYSVSVRDLDIRERRDSWERRDSQQGKTVEPPSPLIKVLLTKHDPLRDVVYPGNSPKYQNNFGSICT